MSKVTVSQAAKLTGKSRETINKATKAGTLSCSRNASNHKVIDVSELERVYPFVTTIDEIDKESQAVKVSPRTSEPDSNTELVALREKLAGRNEMHDTLVAERNREREQLASEIETLRTSLGKSQDQHGKAMLLITDQSKSTKDKTGDWEEFQRKIENRLVKHEEHSKQAQEKIRDSAKRKISQLEQALAEEKNKSIFQKVFGWE